MMERIEATNYALIKYYYRENDKPEEYIGCAHTKMLSEIVEMFSVIKDKDISCQFNELSDQIEKNI